MGHSAGYQCQRKHRRWSCRVTLWVRDPLQAQVMANVRENVRYLPGIRLPAGLHIHALPASRLGLCAEA
jgi:glycerol-3-phosphate dehydrogenase